MEKQEVAISALKRQVELRNSMGGHPYWLMCHENVNSLSKEAVEVGCDPEKILNIVGDDKFVTNQIPNQCILN